MDRPLSSSLIIMPVTHNFGYFVKNGGSIAFWEEGVATDSTY